jgi:hypothetical protein
MSCDRPPDTVDGMKKLLVAVLALLALAGCSSPPDPARWTGMATSAEVVSARGVADRGADSMVAQLPLKVATKATEDSCGAGTRDEWYTSQYQYSCTRQSIYYLPLDGPLLPVLTQIDHTIGGPANGLITTEPLQNVQFYYAHGGKDSDGRELPRPRLAYDSAVLDIGVSWRDRDDQDLPQLAAVNPSALSPGVYETGSSAVDLPGLVAAHTNVIALFVSQTYFTVPWPSP